MKQELRLQLRSINHDISYILHADAINAKYQERMKRLLTKMAAFVLKQTEKT